MNTLPPHANNGKFHYPTPPAKTSGVYAITNTINGKQYIGSSQDIQLRWQQHRTHLHTKSHHSLYLQRAWDKYGEEHFIFQIIEEVLPEQCVEREQYWIDTLAPSYNILPNAGSPRGYKASEETRAKLSEAAKQRHPPMLGKHHSKATKAKIAQTRKERAIPSPAKGKTLSEEQKAKLSAGHTGKPLSEEHKQAISRAQKGKKKPIEMGAKVSDKLTGVKHSPERVAKNSLSHMGQRPWNKGMKKEKQLCLIDGCTQYKHAKGVCRYHYERKAHLMVKTDDEAS